MGNLTIRTDTAQEKNLKKLQAITGCKTSTKAIFEAVNYFLNIKPGIEKEAETITQRNYELSHDLINVETRWQYLQKSFQTIITETFDGKKIASAHGSGAGYKKNNGKSLTEKI
jgi:hypothetical protein